MPIKYLGVISRRVQNAKKETKSNQAPFTWSAFLYPTKDFYSGGGTRDMLSPSGDFQITPVPTFRVFIILKHRLGK